MVNFPLNGELVSFQWGEHKEGLAVGRGQQYRTFPQP